MKIRILPNSHAVNAACVREFVSLTVKNGQVELSGSTVSGRDVTVHGNVPRTVPDVSVAPGPRDNLSYTDGGGPSYHDWRRVNDAITEWRKANPDVRWTYAEVAGLGKRPAQSAFFMESGLVPINDPEWDRVTAARAAAVEKLMVPAILRGWRFVRLLPCGTAEMARGDNRGWIGPYGADGTVTDRCLEM